MLITYYYHCVVTTLCMWLRPGIGDNALPSRLEGDPHARIASVEAKMAQATSEPHMDTSSR
jgi:hypothetical protein